MKKRSPTPPKNLEPIVKRKNPQTYPQLFLALATRAPLPSQEAEMRHFRHRRQRAGSLQ
ncbi:hypothetical protein BJX68DRAFT_234755 [Aspergillus pseudodeflectus]|uniref:Uncharacterized protein n=1 Tax=Aspergillus pseudodeflectus TaxID=176178 RepID=A0ABR4KKG8_9EURO